MRYDKKYWILFPPFIITALVLAIYLPAEKRFYSPFVGIAFWITYYCWKYIENKRSTK